MVRYARPDEVGTYQRNNTLESDDMTFADITNQYYSAKNDFEEKLYELCPDLDYNNISCDDYDSSIEFYEVPNDVRLTDEAQKFIHENGFAGCWLNHQDGWETLYEWKFNEDYKLSEGWRKRQHKRKLADGTLDKSQLVEVEDKFPESWPKEWLESGYVTIIPTNNRTETK